MNHSSSIGKSVVLALALVLPLQAAISAEPPKDQGPTNVEVPPILAPMVVANRLESYAYITIALAPASRDKVFAIRVKMPFLQDAFLRELNKASIVRSDDPKTVDTAALKARLIVQLNRILPPGTVADLKFEQIVLTPIQPQS
jgi:flagellar basal body-associated protein FliL